MRRGWPPLPPLLPPLLLLLLLLGSPGALAARRRPRAAYGTAYGTSYGTYGAALNLDDLELLAQIADAPVDDGKLTCYTCNNGTDNDQCNKYAIDRPCEPGLSMCRTEHVIERLPVPASGAGAAAAAAFPSRPRSVRITKSCVSAAECSRAAVGCRGVAGDSTYLRVCTSCCDWSYCNELAPADPQTAVLAVSRSGGAAGAPSRVGAAAAVLALLLLRAATAVF